MRTVTFGVANSLDNFIARKDESVDWLLWGKEASAIMADYWKTIDTIVWGRKTYEFALRSESPADTRMRNYVLSRTLRKAGPHVEIIAEDAGKFVRKLKRRKGKGICVMSGGELARSLFEADVIDELGLNIHPVLLGSGVPLFLPMKRQVDLRLIECNRFKNGCVFVKYSVKH